MRKLITRKKVIVALAAVVAALSYVNTRGNVQWRVHQHYQHAKVERRSEGTPESSLDGFLLRSLGFRYVSPFEPVAITITGASEPVDFDHFRGMLISYLTVRKSTIKDLRPLLTEYRPVVSIFHCDLTALPEDQRAFLHFQPDFERYSVYTPEDQSPRYPGGVGLHSHSFYP
jgi:hypothetical protein